MAQTEKTITLAQATSLQLTLQSALETFEEACQCGECCSCTNGQDDLRTAIRILDDIQNQGKLPPYCDTPNGRQDQ